MILQVSGVCVSFDGKDILKDCSFHIEEGEKCAIVGINGAGKSTLLKVITGNLSQDSGTVTMKAICPGVTLPSRMQWTVTIPYGRRYCR